MYHFSNTCTNWDPFSVYLKWNRCLLTKYRIWISLPRQKKTCENTSSSNKSNYYFTFLNISIQIYDIQQRFWKNVLFSKKMKSRTISQNTLLDIVDFVDTIWACEITILYWTLMYFQIIFDAVGFIDFEKNSTKMSIFMRYFVSSQLFHFRFTPDRF